MTKKPRRRVVKLSSVDEDRLKKGLSPSWLDPKGDSSEPQFFETNDQWLQENVPPHS